MRIVRLDAGLQHEDLTPGVRVSEAQQLVNRRLDSALLWVEVCVVVDSGIRLMVVQASLEDSIPVMTASTSVHAAL